MRVSIIMPSFNHAAFISEAIESVLAQSHRPLELIIVDGASTDGSPALIQAYAEQHPEIRWLSEPDNGPADAVNKGLSMASGEVIGIQSSDDLYVAGALRDVVREFQEHLDCGLIYGDVEAVDTGGIVIHSGKSLPDFSWEAWFGRALIFPQGSIFFRRSLAEETGGWNSAYYGCDLDYWMRLAFRTRPRHVRKVLSYWRMHGGQRTQSSQFRRIVRDYWRMIEESPEVRASNRHIRRLAYASRHIISFTWEVDDSLWLRRWHAIAALWGHPGCWRYFGAHRLWRLVPGYNWARKIVKGLKRPFQPAL